MASAFDYMPIILASQQADIARKQVDAANRQAEADRAAAERKAQREDEQFDYFKQQNEKDRAALQPVIDSYLRTSAATEANALKDRQRYENVAIPIQDQLIADANSYASPERKQQETAAAMALVSGQMEGQRRSAQRNLESFGIDPSATRYAGLDANYRAMTGAAQAAAGTKAGQNVDAVARDLRGQAINMLSGLPQQTNQNYGVNLAAGNQNSGTTFGLTNSAASTTGTAPQYGALESQNLSNATGAINAGTSAVNAGTAAIGAMNQGYGNYYNNQNAGGGSGWGSLLGLAAGTAAGAYFGGPAGAGAGSRLGSWLGGAATGGSSGNGGMRFPIANSSGGFDQGGWGNGVNYAEGGPVPEHASPTDGAAIDDVPARLTAGEFVIPKDTLQWKGEEFFQKLIEQSRKAKDQAVAKPEVGVAPQQPPTFVSRPQGGALPVG